MQAWIVLEQELPSDLTLEVGRALDDAEFPGNDFVPARRRGRRDFVVLPGEKGPIVWGFVGDDLGECAADRTLHIEQN